MKETLLILMLAVASIGEAIAQSQEQETKPRTKTEETFDPDQTALKHKFVVHLKQGNELIISVRDIRILKELRNPDSIILTALQDLQPLQDSLQNEINSKRVDYVIDTNGSKKIRFSQTTPTGSAYLLKQGAANILKIEQDTLDILGYYKPDQILHLKNSKANDSKNFWKMSLVVNNLNDIRKHLNGTINTTVKDITKEYVDDDMKRDRNTAVQANYFPYENKKPYNSNWPSIYIDLPYLEAGMQSFGHSFVPSAGVGINFSYKHNKITDRLTFLWEPLFLFEKNNTGKLNQFRNDFVSVKWQRITENTGGLQFMPTLSFGYLKNDRRRGDFFADNTYKIGLPGYKYKGLFVQPQLMFNNFFKNVTPGFKIGIHF